MERHRHTRTHSSYIVGVYHGIYMYMPCSTSNLFREGMSWFGRDGGERRQARGVQSTPKAPIASIHTGLSQELYQEHCNVLGKIQAAHNKPVGSAITRSTCTTWRTHGKAKQTILYFSWSGGLVCRSSIELPIGIHAKNVNWVCLILFRHAIMAIFTPPEQLLPKNYAALTPQVTTAAQHIECRIASRVT